MIRRAVFVCALATSILAGCTPLAPLSSALVTGDDATVTALNLDTDTVIASLTLPADGVPDGGPQHAVITLKGRVAYLAGRTVETHILKLSDSALEPHPDSPVRIPDGGTVLATAKANPWVLARRDGPRVGTHVLATQNPLDITVSGGAVTFESLFQEAAVCDDGRTVLVRQVAERRIRLFTLGTGGLLTDTGHVLALDAEPRWVRCAPGATAGAVLVPSFAGVSARSFTISVSRGLTLVDAAVGRAVTLGTPGPRNNDVAFAADGSGLFVRSSLIGGGDQRGWVERFSFDPVTAAIGDSAEFAVPVGYSFQAGGEQIAVHPDGGRIYIPEREQVTVSDGLAFRPRVRVLDAVSGGPVRIIDLADIENPLQVVIPH